MLLLPGEALVVFIKLCMPFAHSGNGVKSPRSVRQFQHELPLPHSFAINPGFAHLQARMDPTVRAPKVPQLQEVLGCFLPPKLSKLTLPYSSYLRVGPRAHA